MKTILRYIVSKFVKPSDEFIMQYHVRKKYVTEDKSYEIRNTSSETILDNCELHGLCGVALTYTQSLQDYIRSGTKFSFGTVFSSFKV